MIDKRTIRAGLLWSLFVVAVMFAVSMWAWGKLPPGSQIPVHFGPDGTPDRYGSRFEGLLLLPLVTIGVALLMAALPKIEPRRTNLLQSQKAFVAFWVVIMMVLAGVHGAAVGNAVGYELNMMIIVLILVGAMFMVIGNFLGKLKSNFTMGIRTPWTLTSNLAWNKTHRLAGKLFVLLGALMIVGGFIGRPIVMVWLVIGGTMGIIVVSLPYSYVMWRSDPDRSTQGREEA
ncbi:MAG: DUF1648 domain-containing protein [Gammaproteobacteria bacterium]|nr:DUF1648 domain-containing protein [Gammaproteobacteria bacterium]